jgi:broad specificity phosphatase PhoE
MAGEQRDSYLEGLILVRHAETDWNRRTIRQGHIDIPLNENGHRQSRALADRLRSWKIDAIYSSDLSRAAETARILGDALGLVPRLETGWRERDVKEWGGLSPQEIQERYPDQVAALDRGEDVAIGGGETSSALQARAVGEFERLQALHAGETVLVVSHGGILRVLIAYFLHLELSYISRFSVRRNTGLSVVVFPGGQPRLVLLNDTAHLGADGFLKQFPIPGY